MKTKKTQKTKTEKKLTGKDFAMVRCPNCKTKYYRLKDTVGRQEHCGVCQTDVILEAIPSGKPLSTGKSSPKKHKK